MVALIKQVIKNEYSAFNFVSVIGGHGLKRDPYQIIVLDKGNEMLEAIGATNGQLFEIETCGALIRNIAEELLRHEVDNFRLYFVPQD